MVRTIYRNNNEVLGAQVVEPWRYGSTLEQVARFVELFIRSNVDHFHAYDEAGTVMFGRVSDSSGNFRFLDHTGYACDVQEFEVLVAHVYHEHEEPVLEIDRPTIKESGLSRFMKRLVSW